MKEQPEEPGQKMIRKLIEINELTIELLCLLTHTTQEELKELLEEDVPPDL